MASAGVVAFIIKEDWISGSNYTIYNLVYYAGSTWVAKTNITGSTVAPDTDTANWQLFAHGYIAENLSAIDATDTEGLLGTIGATVTGQALIDELADRVATKLLPIANLVNNGASTVEGFALDSRYGKTLTDEITTLNSNLDNKADKASVATIFSSMPSDADSAFGFASRYPNAIVPYNGLNWTDMPSAQADYYGRIETRGYFSDTYGGTISFYSNGGVLIASRGFKYSGWGSDWVIA